MVQIKSPIEGVEPNNDLMVPQKKDETGAQAFARRLLEPQFRNALSASSFASMAIGDKLQGPGIMDFVDHVQKVATKAEGGDLALASRILASQAVTLDAMFTEFARRSATNMTEYLPASERFARLAFKAQANCRATLDALAKLHQPREQTVRYVHVNEGGQAVIAEQFNHYSGGYQNAEYAEQPQAPCSEAIGSKSALSGKDEDGR